MFNEMYYCEDTEKRVRRHDETTRRRQEGTTKG